MESINMTTVEQSNKGTLHAWSIHEGKFLLVETFKYTCANIMNNMIYMQMFISVIQGETINIAQLVIKNPIEIMLDQLQ